MFLVLVLQASDWLGGSTFQLAIVKEKAVV